MRKYVKTKALNEITLAAGEEKTFEVDVDLLESVKKDRHLQTQIKAVAADETILGETGFAVTFTKDFVADNGVTDPVMGDGADHSAYR